MDGKEAHEICQKAISILKEHFDAVQILATWNEEGETRIMRPGFGNWYARQGMAHEFTDMDTSQSVAMAVVDMMCDDGSCDDPECPECK